MDFTEIQNRLSQLETSCVADTDKALRVMDAGLRPLRSGLKMIGRARTVRCHEDFMTVIQGLAESQPGEVLVIDTHGSRAAVAGELFSLEAARRGLHGIVIDGPVRDTATIRTLDLPVYARSITLMAGTIKKLFETQVPVCCGGVIVHPGDILMGDDDGVLVASTAELATLIPLAEQIQRREADIIERLRRGENLLDMLNYAEHHARIKRGDDTSRLQFVG